MFDRANDQSNAIDVKMEGSFLEEKLSFNILGLSFSSKLDWGPYIISIAKTNSKKNGPLSQSVKCLSPTIALYIYKSTIMLLNTVVLSGLVPLLGDVRKTIKMDMKNWQPSLAASLEPLAYCQNVASLSLL